MPKVPTINALQLRTFTDAAASLRKKGGDPMDLVVTPDGTVKFVPPVHDPADRTLLVLDTRTVQPDRAPVTSLKLEDGVQRFLQLAHKYDAIFWSEASVEKFVFPYYASKSLWTAASVLNVLSQIWYGFVPPVEPRDVMPEVDPDKIPIALAHLPSSEYVAIEEELGSRFHVIFKDLTVRPLSDFLGGIRAETDEAP